MGTAGSAKWSTDDIRTLLDAMSKSITEREKGKIWNVGLKTFDWKKVAFSDFTPEECNAKWREIMQKLRKMKTLSELIVDAQNTVNNAEIEFHKKPVSANALFFAENKELFKKKKPDLNSRELMKVVNDSYKKLPPEKKEKYLQKVEKAKEKYQDSIKKMTVHSEDLKRKKDSAIGAKERTTLPVNGYNLFCREQKSLLTGVPNREITSVWSSRWKVLSKEEKEMYSKRCLEMKREAKNVKMKSEAKNVKRGKQTFPGEPKMPARSACSLYCKSQMNKMKGQVKRARDRFAMASHEFKTLSQQEKDQYQTIIENNFSMYEEQLQRWFKTLEPNQQQEYCECNPSKIKYLRSKRHLRTPLHRTSDSEDEDWEDSSCSDNDDDNIDEVVIQDEEEETPMFDLF
ncbi:hypothetical protein NL108_011884 [Boleophthalmus pectinirostris]|uniref:nucleolar transcription factor 1-like n=1 Tax=Boleophthalmus pectinirostris TaxID=150288 RepID=UPI002432CA90|nr:nucleolar transcription factor 1-like [Boleophthalmus pectinirostris]KAJ0060466.1 hypothetical protein NL108_011884 [Boleophthalmus pectinirostris]